MELVIALLFVLFSGLVGAVWIDLSNMRSRVEELQLRIGMIDSALSRRIVEICECGTQTAREVDELRDRITLTARAMFGDLAVSVRDEEPDNE